MTSLTLQYERLCPDCLQKLQVGGLLVFLLTTVVEVLETVEEVVTTEDDIFEILLLVFGFWLLAFGGFVKNALLRNECIYHILNYLSMKKLFVGRQFLKKSKNTLF